MNIRAKISYDKILEVKRRRYARNIAAKAIKRGELKKSDKCECCEQIKFDMQAHHVDYGQPLNVMWLCQECHGKAHRKNSALNPRNNLQTPLPIIHKKYERVHITFQVPLKNFIHLTEIAHKKGKPLSKIIESEILKKFPVQSEQLEFNFEVRNDKPQHVAFTRIPSLAKNESLCAQPKTYRLSEVWKAGDIDMSGMDGIFFPFLQRHGDHAARLQCTGS